MSVISKHFFVQFLSSYFNIFAAIINIVYRIPILILLLLFFGGSILYAQRVIDTSRQYLKDSLQANDSLEHTDSIKASAVIDSIIKISDKDLVELEKFENESLIISKKEFNGKEGLFYLLIGLLLLFALFYRLFSKYFNDLYRLFFRTTLNQSQIREQMIQTPLPSLLINIFFVLTGGLYLGLIFRHFNLDPVGNFWFLFLYCSLSLSVIYLVKYLGLKSFGWLFSAREAADTYIFIVFMINKMAGIFLLPFLVLLAFTSGSIYNNSLIISFCGLGALLIYRCLLSFSAIHKQISVRLFHFLVYLFAFEIVPLLVIYKVLLVILNRTT